MWKTKQKKYSDICEGYKHSCKAWEGNRTHRVAAGVYSRAPSDAVRSQGGIGERFLKTVPSETLCELHVLASSPPRSSSNLRFLSAESSGRDRRIL